MTVQGKINSNEMERDLERGNKLMTENAQDRELNLSVF